MEREMKMDKSDKKIESSDNVVSLPSADEIEAEAARWFTVLDREEVSDDLKSEFQQWLHASERHRLAYAELAALWGDLEVLKELDDIAEAPLPEARPQPYLRFRGLRWGAAMAASLLLCLVSGGVYYAYQDKAFHEKYAYATEVGGQRTVEMRDGSVMQLNTNSKAEVSFSRQLRVVRLLQGEAHFEVAKNPRRPFKVLAPGGEVEAVGTAFTVRVRPDHMLEVTVEEGRVALATLPPEDKHARDGAASARPLAQLTAGQRAVFKETVSELEQLPEIELKRKLAWRQGMLAYAGEPLSDVIADIGRYTDIEIELGDPDLGAKLVAGYFKVGETEAMFESLALGFDLKVERVGPKHVRIEAADQ